MNRDLSELKKRTKPNECTFNHVCACYVDVNKDIVMEIKENFLYLDEFLHDTYLKAAKRILSGEQGENILIPEVKDRETADLLDKLISCSLSDDKMRREFYQKIIDNYDTSSKYLILLFDDHYDVSSKDNFSDYDYVLCAICPVVMSNAKLKISETDKNIKQTETDWIMGVPETGFVYPAFIDRAADVHHFDVYVKQKEKPHSEIMSKILLTEELKTNTEKREILNTAIKNAIRYTDTESLDVYLLIQHEISCIIESENADKSNELSCLTRLTTDFLKEAFAEIGTVPEKIEHAVEKECEDNYGDEPPYLLEILDKKYLVKHEMQLKIEQLKKIIRDQAEKVKE